jgi:hypothetical protein
MEESSNYGLEKSFSTSSPAKKVYATKKGKSKPRLQTPRQDDTPRQQNWNAMVAIQWILHEEREL